MSYQQKNEQTIEQSAKYVAAYFKFQFKQDLSEIIDPLTEALIATGKKVDLIAQVIKEGNDR